jgi:enterochelin esterase family protein
MSRRGVGLLAFPAVAVFVLTAAAQPPDRPRERPGAPPPVGPPGGLELGTVLPPFVQAELRLTREQQKRVADLERYARDRLNKILTAAQKEQLKALRPAGPFGAPPVESPDIRPDRHVVFRLRAPQARSVTLNGDPGLQDSRATPGGVPLTRGEDGVWQVRLGPVDPGAYRYTFQVDGVQVLDPSNTAVSQTNTTVRSLVYVPGSDFMDTRNVPHGAVAAVYYHSSTLGRTRRMHVYTPPGYEVSRDRYPVLYLLHGAGDCDDSWTSVGRAGFILDNLIASGRARPLVVVMPAGHTSRRLAPPTATRPPGATDEFQNDFLKDLRPHVEKNYRVLTDRANRAIAGLSMGGGQTLSIAIPHLKDFGYVGVFSSGLFQANTSRWEKEHQGELENAGGKEGLRLLWFSTGSDDFLMPTTRATVALLKKHGFHPVFKESTGGHTWINWRNYLNEFAPQLFR